MGICGEVGGYVDEVVERLCKSMIGNGPSVVGCLTAGTCLSKGVGSELTGAVAIDGACCNC